MNYTQNLPNKDNIKEFWPFQAPACLRLDLAESKQTRN
jgi:hypothetical protein